MKGLQAALASSNRHRHNTAAAAAETPKEVAIRRSERLSSISKPDGLQTQTQTQDPDLSQDLLDDNSWVSAPARELHFSPLSPKKITAGNNNNGDDDDDDDSSDDDDDSGGDDNHQKKRRLSVVNEGSGSIAMT